MKLPTKIFITGGHGNLGKKLISSIPPNYKIMAPTHKECNILDLKKLKQVIKKYNPDIIIHLAAFVDTFGCENNIESALDINVNGTINIVKSCLDVSCKLVYISSEYVFGGSKGNYTINDKPDPINVYGKTKAAAEYIVSTLPDYQIIRAPFISKTYLNVFEDQYCSRYFLNEASKRIINNIFNNSKKLIHISSKRMSLYNTYLKEGIKANPIKMDKDYLKLIPKDTSLKNNSI
jgi:dTDP-4-dehydrorhamnose reductase|tara:strand:+ start:1654 stop:2355 length:702 start_codon:yes stop_codon:yes gene_type:complete